MSMSWTHRHGRVNKHLTYLHVRFQSAISAISQ